MKKKLLGLVYVACLLFAAYYLGNVLQRQPSPGPVWPAYGERQDAQVDEILALLPEPGSPRDEAKDTRIAELIREAGLESIISLLVRIDYLAEDVTNGSRIQVAEKLAPFTSDHVVLLARKLHKSRVRGGALVSVGELLVAGSALSGGATNIDLYLTAYQVYGYKKTLNRIDVLNGVMQGAAAATTLAFLKQIQLFEQDGEVNRVILATMPMSTVLIALTNLERAEEPDRATIEKICLACIQPGNEAADLRSARVLAAVMAGTVHGPDGLAGRVIDKCDADVVETYLRLAGYAEGKGERTAYRPQVLAGIEPELRSLLAEKLARSGYLGSFRQRAISDLQGG